MKQILMIGTGGTIASGKTAEGLMPELTSEQLLAFVPAVSALCRVECLQLLSLDSTNLGPAHWLQIAGAIRARYDRYDGFVPFSDGSWIYGDAAWDAKEKKLFSATGKSVTLSQEAQKAVTERVQEFVRINNLILDVDYYQE